MASCRTWPGWVRLSEWLSEVILQSAPKEICLTKSDLPSIVAESLLSAPIEWSPRFRLKFFALKMARVQSRNPALQTLSPSGIRAAHRQIDYKRSRFATSNL